MRKEKSGWPPKVKVGYGKKASTKGRHPRGLIEWLVKDESDLEGLDPKLHIVRLSGRLGERRRLVLLDRVKVLGVHVANPGKEEARPVAEEATSTEITVPSEPSGKEETEEDAGTRVEGERVEERAPTSDADSETVEEDSGSEETDR